MERQHSGSAPKGGNRRAGSSSGKMRRLASGSYTVLYTLCGQACSIRGGMCHSKSPTLTWKRSLWKPAVKRHRTGNDHQKLHIGEMRRRQERDALQSPYEAKGSCSLVPETHQASSIVVRPQQHGGVQTLNVLRQRSSQRALEIQLQIRLAGPTHLPVSSSTTT